jgi:short-subunit dehydrogenase
MTSTVLITGASQGIGKATALLFAEKGYNLVLASRQPDRLQKFAQELESAGHSALAVPTDVRESEQVDQLVKTALERYGSVDVLINNAGIYISGPAEEFSLSDWHQAIDTNLWGYIHTIHALLPHFIAKRSGTIVNVGSIGGKTSIPYLTPYTTSKFAVTGLTQALHSELTPKGIHVAGVYPNLIKSEFLERAIFRGKNAEDTESRRKQVEQILNVPLVEKPEDVAKAIWRAVKQQQTDVLVGSATLANAASQILPGFLQKLMQKTFQHRDKA